MAFVPYQRFKVGDVCKTTKQFSNCNGIFQKGTKVTVYHISEMIGYSVKDDKGNKLIGMGWTGLEKSE